MSCNSRRLGNFAPVDGFAVSRPDAAGIMAAENARRNVGVSAVVLEDAGALDLAFAGEAFGLTAGAVPQSSMSRALATAALELMAVVLGLRVGATLNKASACSHRRVSIK